MLNDGKASVLLHLAMMMAHARVFVPGLGFVPAQTNESSWPINASNGANKSRSSRRRRNCRKMHHRQKR